MFTIVMHFANGTHHTDVVDAWEARPTHLELKHRTGDVTIVPFAQLQYADVVEDGDESEFGDDAAVFLAPSR